MSASSTRRARATTACAGLLLIGSAALTGTAVASPFSPDPFSPEPPRPAELATVRVSLSAPVAVKRGKAADLGAVVSIPGTGGRAPGVIVILYSRPAAKGAWTEEVRTVTDPRGLATFRARPRTTTDYAAESLPSAMFDGGVSGTVRVKVRR